MLSRTGTRFSTRSSAPGRILMLVIAAVVSVTSASAQTRKPERPTRARAWLDGGARMVEGQVREYSQDSIFIRVRRSTVVVPRSEIERIEIAESTGTKARQGFLTGAVLGAAIGFPLGYCFQIFGDGCAGDTSAGLKAAAAFGLIAGGIGFLMGRRSQRWGPYRSEDPHRVQFQVLTQERLGFGISIRH